MESQRYTVGRNLDGWRLDIALVQLTKGMSRRQVRRIIDIGGAYINHKRVRIASRLRPAR